jgi:competence protein ComEC
MIAPALVAAIPLLLGVILGTAWNLPRLYLAILLISWALAAAALWRGRRVVALAALATGFLACGAVLGAASAREVAQPALLAWQRQVSPDRPVHVVGIAREDAAKTGAGVSLTIDVLQVDGATVDGGVRLSVAGALAVGAAPAWRAGRTIATDVLLREPLDYRDPGVPSDRERLARQGIVLLGSVKSAALTRVIARGTIVSEAAAALRAWVRRATASAVGRWSPRSAGVVTAILIGDRTGLDADDERRLQEAGTYHVIAISGGNIAILTALLVALGRAIRLPTRATAAASIAILAFYGYAAGLAPSVMRATIAGMVYLAARALDHRGPALNALAVAAAVAAVSAPPTILDAGFILSFGATAAIVVAASRIVPGRTTDRKAGRVRAGVNAARSAALALGAATMCAEIALAPVGARLFGRVSFAGLLLNFLAIPLMSVVQVAGLAAIAVASVSASLADACGWIAHVGTTAILGSAAIVDVAPWLVLDIPPPAMWVVVLWYAGWAGLFVARRPRTRRAAIALITTTGLVLLSGPNAARRTLVPPPPEGWTRVVVLDVGQGDATLIQPAGSRPLLVDAGGVPGSTFDLGRRVTLPASWAFGVRTLSTFVLTHGDPDHAGGAPAVLRALAPREIWDGIPVPRHEPLRRLREAALRAGIPWVEKRSGQVITLGTATVTVLNPPDPEWERQKVRNDDSVVLEVRVGDVAFLLPGDITAAVEPSVLERFDPAPIVIVKAPHHGSAGSSSPALVEKTHPAAVIFSAGKRNPFGHPAPVIIDRYRRAGASVFSTADDGAVVIDTDGHTLRVWTWTGRSELLAERAEGLARRSQRH